MRQNPFRRGNSVNSWLMAESPPPRVPVDTNDSSWPKISIVTPSLNQGKFLEQSILSIRKQNYPNLEHILIDGGSTDNTVAILDKYAESFSYFHSKKDNGQADAIATGFEIASGDILCWLNSDDILLPNCLVTVASRFASNRKVDFCYGNRLVINEQGVITNEHVWPRFLMNHHWVEGQPLAQECCFWRRKLYESVGGIDRSLFFIMDYDLFYRMWREGKFQKINRYLGCLRIHSDSKNSLHQDIRIEELEKLQGRLNIVERGPLQRRIFGRVDRLQNWFDRRTSV